MANVFKERNNKFKKNIQNVSKSKNIVGIDETLLSLFCSYILSDKNVHKYVIGNLNRLMYYLSEDSFENQRLINKYNILKLLMEDRMKGLTGDIIKSDVSRKLLDATILYDENFIKELSDGEIEYVEKSITQLLNTMTLDSEIKKMIDTCTLYMNSEVINKENQLDGVLNSVQGFLTVFNKNKTEQVAANKMFKLSSMEDSIEEIHKYVRDPSYNLVTGIQGMNALLGGGFQKGRVYCYFGMSGEGKTTTLENLLVQTWKYNKGIKTKDPTKKPCLVLFTMENLVTEYVCSIFNIITKGKELKNCDTPVEVLQEFSKNQFIYNDESDIELIIMYEKGMSKDTLYCYEIIERLEEEGYEVIGFFMDYLMRIKPQEWTGDQYKDFGNVINDFKTLALLKDMPVITASQLNREATKVIEEGRQRNQMEILSKLGTAHVGDSIQIIRNLDGAFLLLKERDANGNFYMGYKLIKHRYVTYTLTDYFYHPFESGKTIALVEDLHEIRSLSRTSLTKTFEETRKQFVDVTQQDTKNTMEDFEEFIEHSTGENMIKNLVMSNEPQEPMKELTEKDVIIDENTTKIDIITVVDKDENKTEEVYNVYFPGKKINRLALI